MAPSQDDPLPRWGPFELYEPLVEGRADSSWVAREEGALQLVSVRRAFSHDGFRHPQVQRLTHPRLVSLLERRVLEGCVVQVQELVLGISLGQVVRHLATRRIWIPWGATVAWAGQLLEGLRYLHQVRDERGQPLQLTHGNLTASQVQVDAWGALKLDGYGLLRAPSEEGKRPDDGKAWAELVGQLMRLTSQEPDPVSQADRKKFTDSLAGWASGDSVGLSAVAEGWQGWRYRLPAPAESTVLADWLRQAVPELEEEPMERLERVRELAERHRPAATPTELAPRPSSDPAHRAEWVPPEPPEPSVMTMPGVLMEPGRVAASRVDVIPRPTSRARAPSRAGSRDDGAPQREAISKRRVRWPVWAVTGLALVLATVAGFRAFRAPARPSAEGIQVAVTPQATGTGRLTAGSGASRPSLNELDIRPLQPQAAAASTEVFRGGADLTEPAPSPNRSARSGARSRRRARPPPTGSSRPASRDPEPASAKPEPVEAQNGASSSVNLDPDQSGPGPVGRQVHAALNAPEDKVLFEEALSALRKAARSLPADRRSSVEAAIQRAEFSWRPADLQRAHTRFRDAR